MPIDIDAMKEWGRTNGWDIPAEGRLPSGLRAAYDSRNDYSPPIGGSSDYELPIPDSAVDEIAPVIKTESKAKAFVDRVKSTAVKPKTPVRGRSKAATKARVGLEKLVGLGWRMAAQAVAPINLPVARVLDMQTPIAGMILEDKIRGTLVDRILQPVARLNEGGEAAFALIGPPMLVGLLSYKPELMPTIRPMLREALVKWIELAGPQMDALAAKEAKFKEDYGTRIDDMITLFFATPEEYAEMAVRMAEARSE